MTHGVLRALSIYLICMHSPTLLSSSHPRGDDRSTLSIKKKCFSRSPAGKASNRLRMGQRHNRRRTRPRSHHRTNSQDTPASVNSYTSLAAPSSTWSPSESISANHQPVACPSPGSPVSTPALTWHYGHTTWQIRDFSRQQPRGLEAEQCRLFGGEPGDDVNLCYRMLEYFGGLDYIDS